ncbi:MAG: DUF1599 domain-containing protein [Chitinophagales bacterium]
MERTLKQYNTAFDKCRTVFLKKTKDYGTSWRVFRIKSITDQLYIKAKRIRTIDEKGQQKIGDSVESEFMACVNYGVMGLIQLSIDKNEPTELSERQAAKYYDEQRKIITDLMIAKNHDYGEAWRDMRISSYTDMILTKLHRVKQIEENDGKTLISEGIDGHYSDIVNYAIFAMIKIEENRSEKS